MIQTLFSDIQSTSNHVRGWATLEKEFVLASAVLALRPEISMELGIFGGKSFFPMALAHRAIGKGRVIGIDPWSPVASAKGQNKTNAGWWGTLDHDMVYSEFMRLRKQFGVENVTEIIRTTSDDYDPSPGLGILSIDANHGPQSIRDVERYAPCVLMGGLVFCDDLTWDGNFVQESIKKLMSLGFRELFRVQNKERGGNDDWGVYQKIR